MFFIFMAMILFLSIAFYFKIHRKPCLLMDSRAILCISFVLGSFLILCVCMLLYMSKSTLYSNLLQNLFFLNKQIINRLMWFPISREMLNRLMNITSLSFTMGFITWTLFLKEQTQRKRVVILAIISFAAIVLTDPDINNFVYQFLFPNYISSEIFRGIQNNIQIILVVLRFIAHFYLTAVMTKRLLNPWGFKEMRLVNLMVLIFSILIQILFFLLFLWSPSSLAHYQVYSGMTSYARIPLLVPFGNINMLVLMMVGCFLSIIICLFYQWNYERRMGTERQGMLRSTRDTCLISRTFAHYMKNEMLVINTEIEMAMENEKKEMEKSLMRIQERCHQINLRLDRMRIQNLNSLSVIQADIQEVIAAIVDRINQDTDGTPVYWKRLSQPIMLWIDPLMISEAIKTVLTNALEATSMVPPERKTIYLNLRVLEHVLAIVIEDHGMGIPPERLPYVFEPYYTSKPTCTNWGLGLYMCRQIVLAHGGRVEIKSKPNQYTTVVIYLPIFKERYNVCKGSGH